MQKPKISILIVMTFLFVVCLTGFFFYRNYFREPVVPTTLTTQKSYSTLSDNQSVVNINTASAKELSTLPGIGETLAQRIVDYRLINGPFQEIDQLLNVDGIGSGKLKAILDMITTQEVRKQ